MTEAGELVAESVPVAAARRRAKQPHGDHSGGRGRNATSRRLTRQFLENQGYTVLEAADGAAAVQICVAHQGPIHLLLTDVIMPGMNGRELAQRVSEIRPNTKVLYMSGYTENAIGHNGTLDAGITLLQKPFTLPALKAKVREVLDHNTPPGGRNGCFVQLPHSQVRVTRDKLAPFRAQRFNLHLPLRYRKLGEQGWRKERPRTSAAPACSSRRKKCCSPTCNSKSTWCCRRKLLDSVPPKSSAAEKWCAPSMPETAIDESCAGGEDSAIPLPARLLTCRQA